MTPNKFPLLQSPNLMWCASSLLFNG